MADNGAKKTMNELTDNYERRVKFRRASDRNFKFSIACLFALTFILGLAIGEYDATRRAIALIQADAVNTIGKPASR